MSGSVAGAFAGFIVTPFDVIKTRLMTSDNKLSTIQVVKEILSENGLPGLYRGATIRMAYLCAGGFAFFGLYEQLKLELSKLFN